MRITFSSTLSMNMAHATIIGAIRDFWPTLELTIFDFVQLRDSLFVEQALELLRVGLNPPQICE
ncbi:exported hypothetical protein [Paraburkholderia piptadeniae]|uniref:Uncharacterized protein n=1 Tax=Paraburkholderia piptadeniae TaxID=1701573 RepID=A0A1N7SX40_9BURK|nr:exported hypothetical protein [Paraburkholderia piptadeniae]